MNSLYIIFSLKDTAMKKFNSSPSINNTDTITLTKIFLRIYKQIISAQCDAQKYADSKYQIFCFYVYEHNIMLD